MSKPPAKVAHPTQCPKGGKHVPVTKEGKVGKEPIKWDECNKCGKRTSGM